MSDHLSKKIAKNLNSNHQEFKVTFIRVLGEGITKRVLMFSAASSTFSGKEKLVTYRSIVQYTTIEYVINKLFKSSQRVKKFSIDY